MDDLITWLRAQIDEIEFADWHERTCQTHQKMPPNSPLGLGGSPLSCNCAVPDFVLREVEAKRQLMDMADMFLTAGIDDGWDLYRLLALPFSDRPGYREEWRP
jgi:hypothetical protein